jgi:hypothetical protein
MAWAKSGMGVIVSMPSRGESVQKTSGYLGEIRARAAHFADEWKDARYDARIERSMRRSMLCTEVRDLMAIGSGLNI